MIAHILKTFWHSCVGWNWDIVTVSRSPFFTCAHIFRKVVQKNDIQTNTICVKHFETVSGDDVCTCKPTVN